MKTVIIVSKCLRVTNLNCEFHFKGVYAGNVLDKVILIAAPEWEIKKEQEYLLSVQVLAIEDGVLRGRIIKARKLDECWDLS